ncbi:MAG: (2Fe-2S)-binding protein [Alphaproteobacteria bacterium]|jgi:aerobic-type carbon monoxide dehydrogenase small subunit (CoxS/CutS family)|nr:(2Fe-2S)-binding protein [Alphaproteobacteria bacterium]MDP6816579.1 (2Fe-2S)-binding protein [Alphaproteobacteria bacterium]|tara:strand:- start:209 stop:694 length:486 start_codon:yes stop_codon:yes gene_type:complete
MSSNEHSISLRVNGREVSAEAPARMHAADFLRHRLGLTGTHVGCEQGVCGMCTILLDGEAVKSCLLLAMQLEGADVRTVESLAEDDRLSDLQAAFKKRHALQCGFCTPGFLMLATGLKSSGRKFSRDEIRGELSGVLCRCTGYDGIVRAVEDYLGDGEAVG